MLIFRMPERLLIVFPSLFSLSFSGRLSIRLHLYIQGWLEYTSSTRTSGDRSTPSLGLGLRSRSVLLQKLLRYTVSTGVKDSTLHWKMTERDIHTILKNNTVKITDKFTRRRQSATTKTKHLYSKFKRNRVLKRPER